MLKPLMLLALAVVHVAAAPPGTVRDRKMPSVRESDVVTAPGIAIHVLQAGRATDKPPLVLVPGWRFSAQLWQEQIAAFSPDRLVIAIDPRSQAGSTKAISGNTPEDRAADIKAVIGRYTSRPVVLVGWSQGVQDVAAYVSRFGVAKLKGVVLVDSTISGGFANAAGTPAEMGRQLRQIAAYVREPRAATEGMMHAIIRKPLRAAEFDQLIVTALKTPSTIGAAMLVDDLLGPDRTPALLQMTVPTLVVASEHSPELEGQRDMAGKLARGRFAVIKGAGHAVFVDQPAIFDEHLRTFLTDLDRVR